MIQLQHIHFGYNQTELFFDVHIDIPMGRIYGLLGKNGVGKNNTTENPDRPAVCAIREMFCFGSG